MDSATAGVVISGILGASAPITAAIIKFGPKPNGHYAKAVDVVRLDTEFKSFRNEMRDMKRDLATRLDRIDKKLDEGAA